MRKRHHYFQPIIVAIVLLFIVLLNSCNNASKEPDVSKVEVKLETYRFDLDLYALDTNRIGEGLQKMKVNYPDFLDYFLDTLMAYGIHGNYNDTAAAIREGLKPFLTFKDFVELENSIKKQYPDTKETDKQLVEGFKRMKYYFPGFNVPKVIYLNLGLSKWPAFPLDTATLCIALDMFLGDDFPHYRSIGIPEYMNSHLRPNYIPVSTFTAFFRGFYPFHSDDRTLLDLMIQRGKEQYFLHRILPSLPDSSLFGFRQQQLDWCNANEARVYNYFKHQNLFFNKEPHAIMPYVTDGPFAKGLEPATGGGKTTPGNIGTWLGYRIVSAYMEQHPEISLKQLLDVHADPEKILDEAKYRPKDQ
jgi:hypothetical protein